MSPLTIYTSHGLPKVPVGPEGPQGQQGEQGPQGERGLQGPQGQQGQAAPVLRWWNLVGDNSGDSANGSNTAWSTVKSPVFTAPAAGWYKVRATFNVFPDNNATTMALALMVDTTAARMFYATANATSYLPVSLAQALQLTAGQKVTIGYRPTVSGRQTTLVNSNTIVPILTVEESSAPT